MLEKLAERLWWVRGAAAAFTLVVFLVDGIGWDRTETLRFLHALVAGWTKITGILGQYVSVFLPIKIGTPEINALMLINTILIPWVMTLGLREYPIIRRIFMIILIIAWACIYFAFFNDEKLSPAVTLLTILIPSYPMLRQIIRKYPFYLKGLWKMTGFIIMLEILYFANLPIVNDEMNKFTCSMLSDCSTK